MVFLTEYTVRYLPGAHPRGVTSERWAGPSITASSFAEAEAIAARLTMGRNGEDWPLVVIGQHDETIPWDQAGAAQAVERQAIAAAALREVDQIVLGDRA